MNVTETLKAARALFPRVGDYNDAHDHPDIVNIFDRAIAASEAQT